MIGTTIGNYQVLERIGDGGMGTVYRGMDQMLDREVALKVMRPELSRQATLSDRFRQEAIALARLAHVNIAAVYGLERSGNDPVMVMEFIRGETLEAIVQRSGRIAWPRAFELAATVADALDHAHDKGVVHRDIKPANIMLTKQGVVKVMDFGIARILGRSRQTRVGAAVGTPMYMSPEQLKGEEVDGRSDVYSLGAVLFELVTGRLAFEADSDYDLMMKQLHEPPPAVRTLQPDVPAVVDEVLQRSMAKRADDRFASARDMANALREAMPRETAAPRRPAPATRLADVPPVVADRQVPVGSIAITADHPAPVSPVAPTRLADTPSQLPQVASGALPPAATPWFMDWRTWAGAAAMLLVAALVLRLNRESTNSDNGGLAVQPGRAALGAARAETVATKPPAVVPAPEAVVTPPSAQAAPPTVLGEPLPVRREPARPAPQRPRATPPPPAITPPSTSTPQPVSVEPTRPTPEPEPKREEPAAESRGSATAAIGAALDRFASAVGSGNTGYVSSVLGGGSEEQWLTLMREGRLSMDVSGQPDVDLDGNRATARFAATLNARSAFGANRKRSATFVADLERSGGSWRLRSVRPVGKLDLK